MKPLALVVVLAALSPTSGSAQTTHGIPAPGTHAVTFSLPDGGGAGFGFRKMVSSGANFGIELQVATTASTADSPNVTTTHKSYEFALSPDLRLYKGPRGPVAPFLELMVTADYRDVSGPSSSWYGAAGAGLGVEWFPLESMSISGSTRLVMSYSHGGDGTITQHTWNFNAARSALRLNLYF